MQAWLPWAPSAPASPSASRCVVGFAGMPAGLEGCRYTALANACCEQLLQPQVAARQACRDRGLACGCRTWASPCQTARPSWTGSPGASATPGCAIADALPGWHISDACCCTLICEPLMLTGCGGLLLMPARSSDRAGRCSLVMPLTCSSLRGCRVTAAGLPA